MIKKGLIASLGGFIVAVSNALISLFMDNGVENFSDVNEVSYATAVLGGLVAAVMAYRARVADVPKDPPVNGV